MIFILKRTIYQMSTIHPRYITDSTGAKLVVITQDEFETIMEELEDLEDVRLYDEAKAEDDGERISLNDYIKERKARSNATV